MQRIHKADICTHLWLGLVRINPLHSLINLTSFDCGSPRLRGKRSTPFVLVILGKQATKENAQNPPTVGKQPFVHPLLLFERRYVEVFAVLDASALAPQGKIHAREDVLRERGSFQQSHSN